MRTKLVKKAALYLVCFLSFFPAFVADASEQPVAAKVNGRAVTVKMMDIAADRLVQRELYHREATDEELKGFRKRALEGLIDEELMYQDALAKGLKPDERIVEERMQAVRGQFDSKKEYKDQMKREGLTEKSLRAGIERVVLINEAVDAMVAVPSRMSDEALREYYEKNLDKFKEPEKVRVRIISTKDEKKAKDIMAELQAGKDFGDVAARMSEDDYRIMGGDMGYIHRGRLVQEVEDAAFKLKAGETSGLTKVGDKWVVVKVEDRKPERLLTFEESKDKLKKELEEKRAKELRSTWIAGLRAKAKIEILWKPAPGSE